MIIDTPEAMLAAGRDFAGKLQAGDLATLSGGLGAGKTLFSKGVLQGLGFAGDVPSPTFTIVNHYAPPDTRLFVIHADLYRLNAPEELEEIGLLDDADAVQLVEWPERVGRALAHARYQIKIEIVAENSRKLTIEENG